MKRLILSIIAAAGMAWAAYGQENSQPRSIRQGSPGVGIPQQQPADLPKFDLDFPGGTPQQLVDAIRKEIGTLNAIIPTEHKNATLPPLKMREVNAKQLFEALELANQRTSAYPQGMGPNGQPYFTSSTTSIGFRTSGPISPESVWYFYVPTVPTPGSPKVVRYYQLGPYLLEYKIDDITTAIQAGWKMLDEPEAPKLNFHQDTKLLIAVGQANQLTLIDAVLSELNKGLSPESRERVRITGTGKPDANK